ncbi:MAG: tetratricopeptide repeat protein [Sphingobacteriales bacterium JAD_PAG50586_3]|nr:MAG: tetratricopeptide repeat protein [Sphingobacteriales bacterium JAD_PAG50586_3]
MQSIFLLPKRISLTVLLLCFFTSIAVGDSTSVNRRIYDLERSVKQIDTNQLNYKIEKDLLKETYSNNYEQLSMIITIVLGIIGVLGYLGIRDINSIKKEYEKELNTLKNIKGQFDLKSQEIDTNKQKLDEELRAIIKENEEQSRKIKIIEIKDKIRSHIRENTNIPTALEYVNAALEMSKDDVELLNEKGLILCRMNQFKDALSVYKKALTINPDFSRSIFNTVECLYFINEIDEAKKIIKQQDDLFKNRDNGKVLELFNLIELYFKGNKDELIKIAKEYVTIDNLKVTQKKLRNWSLFEAKYFALHQPDSDLKLILQNIFWYWDGQINGELLLSKLGIEFPK